LSPNKPMDSAPNAVLPRQLSGLSLWLLMINGMIGAAIFGVPAEAARLAGDFSPMMYLLCAVLVAPVMLCFAELGSATRDTGGPVRYVAVAFGPMAGFQTGWALYIARMTGFAANINLMVAAFVLPVPALASGLPRLIGLTVLCAAFAWINVVGVRRAMQSLGGLTLLKLAPLLLLALVGLFYLPGDVPLALLIPGGDVQFGAAILLIIYAFVGFESGLVPAGEARDPQRDMPRALLLSLAACAVLYALLQWVCLVVLDDLESSTRPLVDLGQALLGPIGGAVLLATVVTSVGGNLLASMFSAPRITVGMGEQGMLPAVFARVHPRRQTPVFSILCYAVLAWLLAATGSFIWLASLSVLIRVLIYVTCVASIPRVRLTAAPGAIRLPGGIAIPVIAGLMCLLLLVQVTLPVYLATAGLLAVGTALYGITRWR